MARKIVVYFLLLLTGTWMAWGDNGSTNRNVGRARASETETSPAQLPSVMRRSSAQAPRHVDRPPTGEPGAGPATNPVEEPRRKLPILPPTTSAPAAPSVAPNVGTGTSPLPTVLRRKPKSNPEGAPNEFAPPETTESVAEPPAVPPTRTEAVLPRPFGASATRNAPQRERASAATAAAALLQGSTPGLRVEAIGPRNMRRGSNARYVINVTNTGDLPIEDLEVRLSLPNSVTLSSSDASAGESRRVEESEEMGLVIWALPSVAARGHGQLVLQLVPHNDRAIELGLDWVCRSPRQVAMIEVQQPQLELSLSGSKDARFGESLNYLVTVANPGSGDAENVVVKLTVGQNAPESVTVGSIAAGQQKQIEVQMTANQPGDLKLVAEATGEGDLRAESTAEISVRRAELQANVTGPKTKFAGVPSLYQVRVSNAGNAPADDVAVQVVLPAGARVESATEGARQTSNSLVWKVATLGASAERVFEVRCELSTAGENKIETRVSSGDGLTVNSNLVTLVEALADLKLTVQEPKGPRQIGDELVYEIVVGNRGTKAAEDVNVVMQFADGIEPLNAEGKPAEIADGQVVFEPIARLAAGQQVTFRVRARADKSGGKRFRAEVQCQASDTQLVSEGTTRVFGEDGSPTVEQASSSSKPAGLRSSAKR